MRLTKKDGIPVLSLTIVANTSSSGDSANGFLSGGRNADPFGDDVFREENLDQHTGRERETIVTQDIPVRVLTSESVEGIHEPKVREPDVHLLLPPLLQLKAISDRFTKLATATSNTAASGISPLVNTPKLELSANMHGSLRLSIATESLNISSVWEGLTNPVLNPSQVEGGIDGIQNHPTTKRKESGPNSWATVRIDGRDWSRVLSVGRMGGRVIACQDS